MVEMPELQNETEQQIIEAATDVFLEKGKSGARMQEIADRAGINKALLHYYFRSKILLYQRVFASQAKILFSGMLEAMVVGQDLRSGLYGFVDRYMDIVAGNPRLISFIMWEIREGGEEMSRILKEKFQEMGFQSVPLLEVLRTGKTTSGNPIPNPEQFFLSLMGMCIYPFIARPLLTRVVPELRPEDPDFLTARKQHIMAFIDTYLDR